MSFLARLRRMVRLFTWSLRIVLAVVTGTLFRKARSMAGREPRILHGMSPSLASKYMVRSDRLAGFPSHSAVWHPHKPGYELVRDQDFDKVMGSPGVATDDVHWLSFIHVLLHADIWVAYFEGLFFHRD